MQRTVLQESLERVNARNSDLENEIKLRHDREEEIERQLQETRSKTLTLEESLNAAEQNVYIVFVNIVLFTTDMTLFMMA